MSLITFQTKYGFFTCYSNDIVFSSSLRSSKIYEEDLITQYIVPILKKYDNEIFILDIGGHIGTHTILYSRLLNCRIIAFEPQKRIYELLQKNVHDNQLTNCTLHNCAVGHTNIRTTLSDTLYDGYNCKIEYDVNKILNYGGIGLGENGEQVNMITIDSLNLDKCDYIKIDIEGAEILALMGAESTIHKFKPLIWFECTDKTVSDEMKKSMDINFEIPNIIDYLTKFGYSFYELNESNILAFIQNKHDISV
jgi:FkbM family methyltransferase